MDVKKDFVAGCLFCKIVAGEIPSKAVYQDEDVYAFQDIHPQAKYHILLIPRHHSADSLNDLDMDNAHILPKIFAAARAIARDLGIDQRGYRLVTNTGLEAGQSVFHLHFHLLGGSQLGLFGAPGASTSD